MAVDDAAGAPQGQGEGLVVSWVAIVISICSLALSVGSFLYQSFYLRPRVRYVVTEISEWPTSTSSVEPRSKEGTVSVTGSVLVAIKRAELPGPVTMKYAVKIHLRSDGGKSASSVQVRVRTTAGAAIIQVNTEDTRLVEQLPDIGRQGSPELFVNVPLMVPGEEVSLTCWYGIPNSETKPAPPAVQVRHSEGLGVRLARF